MMDDTELSPQLRAAIDRHAASIPPDFLLRQRNGEPRDPDAARVTARGSDRGCGLVAVGWLTLAAIVGALWLIR